MKVCVTFHLTTFQRRAIAHAVGETQPAPHHACRNALESWALLELQSVVEEYLGILAGEAIDTMVHGAEGDHA